MGSPIKSDWLLYESVAMMMTHKGKATDPTKISPSRTQPHSFDGQTNEDPFARDGDISMPLGSPPILVIRAIAGYTAKRSNELCFHAGDFFHVTDVFTDDEGVPWFQAENPLESVRGIVPSSFFVKFGPNRPSNLLTLENSTKRHHRRSPFFAFGKGKNPMPSTKPTSLLSCQSPRSVDSSPTAESKTRYQSLCGTMKYNFVGERSDELSARYGEPVIIMAHSAHEWFVAKPIGRLGGPGFIPASYVDLQEIKTCRGLSPIQAQDLIPTVEEWKERVAKYKASSVALGVVAAEDSNPPSTDLAYLLDPCARRGTPSNDQALRNQAQHIATLDEPGSRVRDWRERQEEFIQCTQEDDGLSLVKEEEEEEMTSSARIRKGYGILQTLKVTSFHRERGDFWYQVHAHFQSPDDEPDRRRALILYRLEAHFATLESDLELEFDKTDDETLPKLTVAPPPSDEMACARRLEELRDYFEELSGASEAVRTSEAVCEFLSHRQGDMEYDRDTSSIKSTKSHSQLKPPTLQLETLRPYSSTTETLRQTLIVSKQMEISDDVRSWITSCGAASPNGVDFAFEEPNYSTRPSSLGTRSPSPPLHLKKSRDFLAASPSSDSPNSPHNRNSRSCVE